jgi:hypothetical protein
MVSDSVLMMTAIDLVVIAMTMLAAKLAAPERPAEQWSRGRLLILLGVVAVGAFYVIDLLTMHVGRMFVGEIRAMQLMMSLHLEVRWLATVVALGLLLAGFRMLRRDHSTDERRLSVMTDALPLALAYIDAHERYRFVNANYARLHAKSIDEIVGFTVAQVVRPDLAPMFRERNSRALQGEVQTYEHRNRLDSDGEIHDLHVDLVPDAAADGKVAGFFVLVRDVTAQARLERDVVRAGEAERLSVARDLHDGLGQSLTGVSLALSALARKLEQEGSAHVAFVKNLIGTTQNTIEQTRQFTHLLAPTMQGGLFSALRALGKEVSALYNVRCYTACPADELQISPTVAMHLYRIAQESVNNATRHGHATTIRIDCWPDDQALVLQVSDDGRGIPETGVRREGIGLKSMHYRSRMIGGSFHIGPGRHRGTLVSCCVPVAVLRRGDAAPAEPCDTSIRARDDAAALAD